MEAMTEAVEVAQFVLMLRDVSKRLIPETDGGHGS